MGNFVKRKYDLIDDNDLDSLATVEYYDLFQKEYAQFKKNHFAKTYEQLSTLIYDTMRRALLVNKVWTNFSSPLLFLNNDMLTNMCYQTIRTFHVGDIRNCLCWQCLKRWTLFRECLNQIRKDLNVKRPRCFIHYGNGWQDMCVKILF